MSNKRKKSPVRGSKDLAALTATVSEQDVNRQDLADEKTTVDCETEREQTHDRAEHLCIEGCTDMTENDFRSDDDFQSASKDKVMLDTFPQSIKRIVADKGVGKIEEKDKPNKHVDKQNKKESKKITPSSPPSTYDLFSYKKHSMDYFTVNGVILRTVYADKKYWYILVIKELLDNVVDFLWKYYQGYSDTSVTVYVTKNDSGPIISYRDSVEKVRKEDGRW